MVFPGIANSPDHNRSPRGDGFGTVTVSSRGVVSFAGLLADGSKVTQSANLSAQGDWPFYLNLYNGGGSMWAGLSFAISPDHGLSGTVTWRRPAMSGEIYPSGFTEVPSEVIGSSYIAPAGKTNRVIAVSNAVLSFADDHALQLPDCPVTLLPGNKAINGAGSPHKVTMEIVGKTGRFSGTVKPGGTGAKVAFQGVFLQSSNSAGSGAGYFLREKLSGRVVFTGAP